jgi:hypothetical protein
MRRLATLGAVASIEVVGAQIAVLDTVGPWAAAADPWTGYPRLRVYGSSHPDTPITTR